MKHFRWLTALVVGAFLLAACGGMQAAVPSEFELASVTTNPRVLDPHQSGNAVNECAAVGVFKYAYKIDEWKPGTMNGTYTSQGVTFTITNDDEDAKTFDWSATAPISAVIVKGGPTANLWAYDPPVTSDTGLYAPGNAGVSHVTFCWNDDPRTPYEDLSVVKTAAGLYDLEYDWTITKTVEPETLGPVGPGESAGEAVWTIDIIKDAGTKFNYRVTGGTITIENPNLFLIPVTIVDVLDVGEGVPAIITCGETTGAAQEVPAGTKVDDETPVVPGVLNCTYVFTPAVSVPAVADGDPIVQNDVTVTVDESAFRPLAGGSPFTNFANVVWALDATINNEVALTDPRFEFNASVNRNVSASISITVTEEFFCGTGDFYDGIDENGYYYRDEVNVATLKTLSGVFIAEDDATVRVLCECVPEYKGETAWAAGLRYNARGNWATFTPYVAGSTVNLYAGQTLLAGTVHFSAVDVDDMVTITIKLTDDDDLDWRLEEMDEAVKIQGYDAAPSGNPSPGQFTTYKGNELVVTVGEYAFYGVHVNVEWLVDATCGYMLAD